MEQLIFSFLGIVVVGMIGQTALIWYKLGKVEKKVERSCPFGRCPLYERAKTEAVEQRSLTNVG